MIVEAVDGEGNDDFGVLAARAGLLVLFFFLVADKDAHLDVGDDWDAQLELDQVLGHLKRGQQAA